METRPRDLITLVNDADDPVGAISKRQLGIRRGLQFRTAHGFIFDDQGRLLLQQLAPARDRHPLRWGSSVAAYVRPGEGYAQAVERRCREELGVSPRFRETGRTRMPDLGGTKHIALFTARWLAQEQIDVHEPNHIERIEWLSLEQVWDLLARDWSVFTETFVWLFARFLSDGTAGRHALSA